jgi:sialate O-acetylesterase
MYRSMDVEGAQVVIHFSHTGSGLASRDGAPLDWFQLAGADGRFVDAQARIRGKDVVVRAPAVLHPVAVRFGWSNVAEPNLMNREGLPAMPFRTATVP